MLVFGRFNFGFVKVFLFSLLPIGLLKFKREYVKSYKPPSLGPNMMKKSGFNENQD